MSAAVERARGWPFGALQPGAYGVVYADPPWAFRTYSGGDKTPTTLKEGAEDHYPTMRLNEIIGLPVADLAARDCALFMWVADSHLDAALDVMRLWGFQFKTIAFTWAKSRQGADAQGAMFLDEALDDACPISMGYWTRKQTEICLLGARGRPARKSAGVREVLFAPRGRHSAKPHGFYDRIESLCDGPYAELFARNRRDGWDAWGNEVDG